MMERTQFTFYESFYRAISRIKDNSDRAATYDAICAYALYGTMPDLDSLTDASAIAFELIKPNLDSSRKKAVSGKIGGSAKQTGSKQEANRKQSVSKTERCGKDAGNKKEIEGEKEDKKEDKKEIEGEKEVEDECLIGKTAPAPNPDVAAVISDYLNRINPSASPFSLEELSGYAEEMGKDVCIKAFNIALDNKKTTWPYIRAILRDKQGRGVKCLADWDALETEREKNKGGDHRGGNPGDHDETKRIGTYF